MKEIYLAGGCFWGVEKYVSNIHGVVKTEVGYANGNIENPTYEIVCTGKTDFAETVKVLYNEDVLSLERLLTYFYKVIDPTIINRQGPDVGTQYRTGIYFVDEKDEEIITASLAKLQKEYDKPIVVENQKLNNYYKAELYHQKYLDKNPEGYCHIPVSAFEKVKMESKNDK